MATSKTILVIGGAGYVGGILVPKLLGAGYTVRVLDLFIYGRKVFDQIRPNDHLIEIEGDIRDAEVLSDTIQGCDAIIHLAAYLGVRRTEINPLRCLEINITGTKNMVEFSKQFEVERFVLVSTDKAVRPVNVMGATKRVAEQVIQSVDPGGKTVFLAVRFGNVIGSSGSVIPIFKKQVEKGGPVTITHPEMTRYFMSIPEASQLILQAGAVGKQGQVFLLDMGEPIRIKDMAFDLIRLSGFEPEKDIPVIYTGLRPGEKLYEELYGRSEQIIKTDFDKLMILNDTGSQKSWKFLSDQIEEIVVCAEELNSESIKRGLKKMIPDYNPQTEMYSEDYPEDLRQYAIRGEA